MTIELNVYEYVCGGGLRLFTDVPQNQGLLEYEVFSFNCILLFL